MESRPFPHSIAAPAAMVGGFNYMKARDYYGLCARLSFPPILTLILFSCLYACFTSVIQYSQHFSLPTEVDGNLFAEGFIIHMHFPFVSYLLTANRLLISTSSFPALPASTLSTPFEAKNVHAFASSNDKFTPPNWIADKKSMSRFYI